MKRPLVLSLGGEVKGPTKMVTRGAGRFKQGNPVAPFTAFEP
jgi:hypothetical protein